MYFFFFSSRRRHTRSLRDWSSDVCSSDLVERGDRAGHRGVRVGVRAADAPHREIGRASCRERSVDLGGRRIIKKKKKTGLGAQDLIEGRRQVPNGETMQGQHGQDLRYLRRAVYVFFKQKTAYEIST